MNTKIVAAASVSAVLLIARLATAQPEAPNEMAAVIAEWNAGKFRPTKEELAPIFLESLASLAEGKEPQWPERRARRWEQLPEQLNPELKISTYGSAFLQSMFLENSAEFTREIQDPLMRRLLLSSKFYLLLGYAQRYAQQEKSETIEPSHLCASLANAWTGLWPICPKKAPAIDPTNPDRE